jgi:hypothetical protein
LDDDLDSLITPVFKSKELQRLLGHHPGFFIVAGSYEVDFSDAPNNLSDFYRIPLIESQASWGSNLVKIKDGEEDSVDNATLAAEIEQRVLPFMGDHSTFISPAGDVDVVDPSRNPNIVQRPFSQVPAQAIIIYLLFRGMAVDEICKKLASLTDDFLYKATSRWCGDLRVPEHTQLNDNIVEKVLEIEEADGHGCEKDDISTAMRMMQTEKYEAKVKVLAKKSLENYFS